jgi:hypothetical protein
MKGGYPDSNVRLSLSAGALSPARKADGQSFYIGRVRVSGFLAATPAHDFSIGCDCPDHEAGADGSHPTASAPPR